MKESALPTLSLSSSSLTSTSMAREGPGSVGSGVGPRWAELSLQQGEPNQEGTEGEVQVTLIFLDILHVCLSWSAHRCI